MSSTIKFSSEIELVIERKWKVEVEWQKQTLYIVDDCLSEEWHCGSVKPPKCFVDMRRCETSRRHLALSKHRQRMKPPVQCKAIAQE